MKKIFSAQSDIKRRLHESGNIRFVSDRFLHDLLNVLDNVRNIYKLGEELESLLSRDNLDTIRYELARIPVRFSVVKDMRDGSGSIGENIGLQRNDFRFPLNPSDYRYRSDCVPDYIPDLETYHHSDPVWCLCSQKQAQRYQVDVPCWSETDSLVDWIRECFKKEVSDVTPEISAVVSESVEETELTSKERIYQYIVQNSPVSTCDLLAQKFVGKSQTHNLRNQLLTEGKIKEVKLGVYTVV